MGGLNETNTGGERLRGLLDVSIGEQVKAEPPRKKEVDKNRTILEERGNDRTQKNKSTKSFVIMIWIELLGFMANGSAFMVACNVQTVFKSVCGGDASDCYIVDDVKY